MFLDLDGVFINFFFVWKLDVEDWDGYVWFNLECIVYFCIFLEVYLALKIVISFFCRVGKSLEELEVIFVFWGIENKIIDKILEFGGYYFSWVEEIIQYIEQQGLYYFFIFDDDCLLLKFLKVYVFYLILIEYWAGFDEVCLEKVIGIVEGWKDKIQKVYFF